MINWDDVSPTVKVGMVAGRAVYTLRAKKHEGPGEKGFRVFHRLPAQPIDEIFVTSDEAKRYAERHLIIVMGRLGFVPRGTR